MGWRGGPAAHLAQVFQSLRQQFTRSPQESNCSPTSSPGAVDAKPLKGRAAVPPPWRRARCRQPPLAPGGDGGGRWAGVPPGAGVRGRGRGQEAQRPVAGVTGRRAAKGQAGTQGEGVCGPSGSSCGAGAGGAGFAESAWPSQQGQREAEAPLPEPCLLPILTLLCGGGEERAGSTKSVCLGCPPGPAHPSLHPCASLPRSSLPGEGVEDSRLPQEHLSSSGASFERFKESRWEWGGVVGTRERLLLFHPVLGRGLPPW